MGHSLISADRSTHLKIIAIALVSAIVLVIIGLIARTDNFETVTAQRLGPALKIGKSTIVTTRDGR